MSSLSSTPLSLQSASSFKWLYEFVAINASGVDLDFLEFAAFEPELMMKLLLLLLVVIDWYESFKSAPLVSSELNEITSPGLIGVSVNVAFKSGMSETLHFKCKIMLGALCINTALWTSCWITFPPLGFLPRFLWAATTTPPMSCACADCADCVGSWIRGMCDSECGSGTSSWVGSTTVVCFLLTRFF